MENEFNQEDQKWILAARKDLEVEQMAKILKVNVSDIKKFLKNNVVVDEQIALKKVLAQNFHKLICKRFIKDQIKKGFSQKQVAENLGLTPNQLIWILRGKKFSWLQFKKEVATDLKSKVIYCKCAKCKITKHNSQFYPDKNTKTGFSSWCKLCNKEACKQRYTKLKILSKV